MDINLLELKEKDFTAYALLRASLLQKNLRRGLEAEALWVGSLFVSDNQEKGLKRKLYQIAAEDVGLGNPYLLSDLLKAESWQEMIALICRSPKNRETNRFHVITKYWVKYFTDKDEETKEEVRTLHSLLKISREWDENKRSKEKLENLRQFSIDLSKKNTESPETIIQAIEVFIDLVRHKVFSSQDLLSLAVLLALRNPKKIEINTENILSPKEQNPVPSFAVDRHTSFGKKLNRSWDHWEKEGVVISPEVFYSSQKDSQGKEKYPMSVFMAILKKK